MEIRKLSPDFKEKYKALYERKGSVFNSFEWIQIYGDSLSIYGIFNNDKKLIGGFHLFETKTGKWLMHLKNPPFTPHMGLFFDNPSGNKSNSLSFEKSISSALAAFIDSNRAQLITLAFPCDCKDLQPFIWSDFKVIPNYTYQLNLELNEDELLKNLSSDKRNSINKADKDGVKVTLNADMQIVKNMVQNTYSRKAKNLNEKIINGILFDFATEVNSYSYVSYVDEKPTAMSFCIYDKTTAYYLLGGYDTNNKHQGAGVLALWNCILHAKKLGLTKFDFEGSMLPAVEKYFRGFGADLIPYFTINKANLLLESALKFYKRNQF